MAKLYPYLTFNGACAEAMTFYKECLNGEITIQKVSDTPMAAQMADQKDKVMHAVLKRDGADFLYASDMMGSDQVITGNTINLCLDCSSEEEITTLFNKISAGGKIGHQLKTEFWGATYGDCIDKFGIRWMFNFQKPKA